MWTIKNVDVWRYATNITWVHGGEYGVGRKLEVEVNPEWMTLTASLSYEGRELSAKRLVLEREVDNLHFLDGKGLENAFSRTMAEGKDY